MSYFPALAMLKPKYKMTGDFKFLRPSVDEKTVDALSEFKRCFQILPVSCRRLWWGKGHDVYFNALSETEPVYFYQVRNICATQRDSLSK